MVRTEIEALVEKIADRVVERLTEKMGSLARATDEVYTTKCLPPDAPSRGRFHTAVRSMPGARKIGRMWVIEKSTWRMRREKNAVIPGKPPLDLDAMAEKILRDPRLRTIK